MQKYNIQNVIAKQNHNRKDTLSQFFIKRSKSGFLSHTANYMDKIPCINLNYTWNYCDRDAAYRFLSQDRPEIFSQTKEKPYQA